MSVVNVYQGFFDSKYRSSGTNPSPVFNLSTPLNLSNPNHYFTASIKSVDIPFSFRAVAPPYNTLRVEYTETPGPGSFQFTITIAPGNYSVTTFLSAMLTEINAGILAGGAIDPPLLNATYDRNTGYVTFTITQVTGSSDTTVVFFWTDPNEDIFAELLGFTGSTNTILNYDAGGNQNYIQNVSQIHVNMSPISSLYIRSTTLTQPTTSEEQLTEFASSVSDILLKVPVTSPYNTWLNYQNADIEVTLNNRVIDVVQFYLTALTYEPINLQGVHWRIHLQLKEIRPFWVDKMEEEARQTTKEVQRLEVERSRMLQELESVQTEMKTSLPSLQQVAITPEEQKEVDQKTLENELMAEVEANREEEKMA